jgi:hypothetical protein
MAMSHVKHFENRSQDQRLSMGEQLMRQIGQGEEVELSFLVGAPTSQEAPETD